MMLIEINWRPQNRQLIQFGLMCALAIPAAAWMWGGSATAIAGGALIGLIVAGLGLAAPQALKPAFLAISIITTPIGFVIGELAMLAIFFCVLMPIGLAMRLVGRDTLALRRDPNATSFWRNKRQPRDVDSYYHPF